MTEITLGGHTRVGFSSAQGGRAGITVTRQKLVVRCLGTYEFRPDQVVAFEPDGPAWMSRGFRIEHNRADAPGRIYFACSGGRDAIVAALAEAGFVPIGLPFKGLRRPSTMQLVFIVMAIAAAVLLSRGHVS